MTNEREQYTMGYGWGETFVSRGWATTDEIKAMGNAWSRFANRPGAIFAAAWCEAVARK